MNREKRYTLRFINDICEENYANAKTTLDKLIQEKIKGRIRRGLKLVNEK